MPTLIRRIPLPLEGDPVGGWRPHYLFDGPTAILDAMDSHVSVLHPGFSPHPPHSHLEEELLIVLDGEAELILPAGPDPQSARRERATPGTFVYYPSYQFHTLRNVSARPVTYLVLRWRRAEAGPAGVGTRVERLGIAAPQTYGEPFHADTLFEGPTSLLAKLHAHVTTLEPGAGYAPHADDYDVAIVPLSGKIETLGEVAEPFGIIYYDAGEPHGMRNAGDTPARYVVFEFHAPRRAAD